MDLDIGIIEQFHLIHFDRTCVTRRVGVSQNLCCEIACVRFLTLLTTV